MKVLKAKIKYQISYNVLDPDSLKVGFGVPFNILIKKLNDYVIIIESGTEITEKLVKMLKNKDATYIAKKDSGKQIFSVDTIQSYIQNNRDNTQKSLELLYEVNSVFFEEYLSKKQYKIDLESVNNIVRSITNLVQHNPHYLKESISHFSSEHKLAHHSLHVSIYAVSIAHALKFTTPKVIDLGIAGLLHDIGMKKIDENIINKEEELSLKEKEAVQQHPIYSTEIARENYISNSEILNAIMYHHESCDGSGYPEGLTNQNISKEATILAICDVFDALTNDRVYREKNSSFQALQMMMKDESISSKFNQKYLKIFLSLLI